MKVEVYDELGIKVRDNYLCIFIFKDKQVKISGFEEFGFITTNSTN